MSNLGRVIAREMAKSGSIKVIPGPHTSRVSSYDEWIKWLSYEPTFEKDRIELLKSKNVAELTIDELNELSRYETNKKMAHLFKIYGTKDCKTEDYLKVYDYMDSRQIEKLMISKLDSDELNYAKTKIHDYCNMSYQELNQVVEKQEKKDEYDNLSMADSFVFHVVSKVNFDRNIKKLDEKINFQLEQNEIMRQRSMILSKKI